jgi:6-phosphogluconolactonase
MTDMSFDDLLIAIIVAGIGLSVAYLRAEYVSWRRYKAAERRHEVSLCELHLKRLRVEDNDVPAAITAGAVRVARSRTQAGHSPVAWLKSRAVLLRALIAMATLTGCHHGGGSGCTALPCLATLSGTLSGLVGSRLTLQDQSTSFQINGPTLQQINGPAANGPDTYFGYASFNTTYDITVATQPTNPSQTCVVTNGTGTAHGSNPVTNIKVTCMTNPPRFMYVANRGSNNVSAYTVDAASGTLAALAGSPFAAGNLPVAIAVDPTGTYAYVANQTDATISAFTIDRTSGALKAVGGSPFPTGPAPTSVAIDPSSSFVYVTNGDAGTVSAYSINAGGALSAVSGSPFATGTTPSSVTVDPLDSYVYVTNQADGTVSEFTNENSNGALTTGALTAVSSSPFTAGSGPRAVIVDPSDQYVYVANAASNTLSGYYSLSGTIQDGGGAITAISGSPYKTGSSPNSVAVAPLDNFVYVANTGSNDISAYALGASGALTALAGSPFTAGDGPSAVAVDPTGSFLYVANARSDNVSVFAIQAGTGALSAVSGSPYAAGTLPSAIAISD